MRTRATLGVAHRSAGLGVFRENAVQSVVDPNLVLWLQRGTNMFTNVDATIPAVANDPVAAWTYNSIVASQATLANRPTRQVGGELLFDGGDFLEGNVAMRDLTRNISAITIYVAVSPLSDSPAAQYPVFWNDGLFRAAIALEAGNKIIAVYSSRGGTAYNLRSANNAYVNNTLYVICGVVNYTGRLVTTYRDGVQVASGVPTWTAGMSNDTTPTFGNVAGTASIARMTADIRHIRAYHAAHDASTVASISAEMAV